MNSEMVVFSSAAGGLALHSRQHAQPGLLTHCQVVSRLEWTNLYGLRLPPIEGSERSDRIVCFLVCLHIWLVISREAGSSGSLVAHQQACAAQTDSWF